MEYEMSDNKNKIEFLGDHGEKIEFSVIEQTKVNGCNYLLVTDGNLEDEEADAYILKDVASETDAESVYEMVEDENELEAIGRVFSELIDDFEIE